MEFFCRELRMRKVVVCVSVSVLLAAIFMSSCTSTLDSVQQAAAEKWQSMVANQFSKGLLKGIDAAITQLSAKDGFLNDPLVHILLPPPLGLAIGVASELRNNPKATVLDALINQAAENAVPVVGPILKDMVMNMSTPTLEGVVSGGSTAATDYLKSNAGPALKQALLPAITQQLQSSGAVTIYDELLKAHETQQQITSDIAGATTGLQPVPAQTVPVVTHEQLGQYVADQTMAGVFKKVAKAELTAREAIVLPH
jgi:hypothetical protein